MRQVRLVVMALLVVVCATAFVWGTAIALGLTAPAGADGPAPCTTSAPAYPFAGFCATYSGDNTWYGTYGPGFPTAQGWGLCADPPASGGLYPEPDFDYVAGGPPPGAGGDWNALGFAFSEGQANDDWDGIAGQFTANEAAAAAKLLYDNVVWGRPVPTMDAGVGAAFNVFANWYDQALGMAASPPQLSVGLIGGGTTFTTSATAVIHLQFPGTGAPLVGQAMLLSITGGTFDSPGGPTVVGVSTDSNGNVSIPIYVDGTGSGYESVTMRTTVGVGQPGLAFYHQTAGPTGAQYLAGFPPPTGLSATQHLQGQPQPFIPQGTISVQKAGNDTAYYGLAGAVFQVLQGVTVYATLTTDNTGATPASPLLDTGTYTVHELTPPPGYQTAPDQTVTVANGANTVVSFTGANEDLIVPVTVVIHKVDTQGRAPLAGAVFDVRYSTADNGTYDQDLGPCTTNATGQCSPAGNDGADLLPGDYEITETQAPPGYYLDPATATQTITLAPGEAGGVTFSDNLLGSLNLSKTGNDAAYHSVVGAVFTVSGPAPSTSTVGTLTVGTTGQTNTIGGLGPGTYTVTETKAPAGYKTIAPVTVTVAVGHATTTVDVLDPIQPATVVIHKVNAQGGASLAGAVFVVRYSTADNGTYDQDLGPCTTNATGQCSPAGNDGADLLPGDYEITETQAPPGYYLDPATATQTITLAPGEAGGVTFSDHLLVPASFKKVVTGNVNPTQVTYAGAVIVVHQGTASGPQVATCTTDASGTCTTDPVIVSGSSYCWMETAAPPGLAGGATGCFTADNAQGTQAITVSDPGLFVPIEAKKVDAANTDVTLPGAVLDLYRVDGGHGPDAPTPPSGAASESGQTWVARATTGANGIAEFGLQYPDFAFCILEVSGPVNYVADPTEVCSGVVTGEVAVPPTVVTITVPDREATVTLTAHKFNSLEPTTGIPGAVYDLYVQGALPPGGVASPPPAGVATEAGDAWYARGTTGAGGTLAFTVPSGHAWCLREVSAPVDYTLDPALHCTGVLDVSSPPGASTVALPEVPATVHLSARKFNAVQPNTDIPGATYELLAVDPGPPGYGPQPDPAGATVPAGDMYWAEGTSDAEGMLTFAVPAGSGWCLHELAAPAGYEPDPGYHCTPVLTTDTPATAMTVALPEQPMPTPPMLPFTGGPGLWLPFSGGIMLVSGGVLTFGTRRRRSRTPDVGESP